MKGTHLQNSDEIIPSSPIRESRQLLQSIVASSLGLMSVGLNRARAGDLTTSSDASATLKSALTNSAPSANRSIDFRKFKVPYNHVNEEIGQFFGSKATIVFNLKIDDPQTSFQFPSLLEIYNRYSKQGLNVLAFPSEQGWFEPDDDETIRAKAKEYYYFGDYPKCVVFDKVDFLGPSAQPFFAALTKELPTPNGYDRITLNYEKFLLDASGKPVRRYPRKYSAYDMDADVQALLAGQQLPEPSPLFLKAWREAKREAVKSEYAFRLNYNYYDSPDSMYKYNPQLDSTNISQ